MEPDVAVVLRLLMPMLSGWSRDEYGKDAIPPLPLSFDRANEGRPPKTTATLFQLPFEILGVITHHLHPQSLASLALVNTDCRQLARSRRFATVKLDYSFKSFCLLRTLLEEGQQRLDNDGLTLSPSLGACIRRVQIATDPKWVTRHHNIDLATFNDLEEAVREQRLEEGYKLFFGVYLPSIQHILQSTLPHVELLDWEDKIPVPRSFFQALTCSSIQHLKLFRISVDEEFEIDLPERLAHCGWPLRTLDLEVQCDMHVKDKFSTSPLCASILRLCAPTLESLKWTGLGAIIGDKGIQSLHAEGLEPPHFSQLHDLELGGILVDAFTLGLLLFPEPQSRLKVLNVDTESDPVRAEFFESCGTVASLETFVWFTANIKDDHPLSFLRSNCQLLGLSLPDEQSPKMLERELIPLLSHSFRNLLSLDLSWDDVVIPESALKQIGTLESLQQLCLSAGAQFGWRHNWLISHGTMRRYLGSLQSLEKLAFRRDSYQVQQVPVEEYYEERSPIIGADAVEEERASDRSREAPEDLWEQQHRQRILSQADEYARLLPKLQWLYFGQIPMGIIDSAKRQDRKAVALTQERDDCWTLLHRIFARENVVF